LCCIKKKKRGGQIAIAMQEIDARKERYDQVASLRRMKDIALYTREGQLQRHRRKENRRKNS